MLPATSPSTRPTQVAFAWHQLPAYAATCISAFINQSPTINVNVLSSRPPFAHDSIAKTLPNGVHWIDEGHPATFKTHSIDPPDVLFVTGWKQKSLNALAAETRKAGGKVVLMIDNTPNGSARQLVGRHYYKFVLSRKYSHSFVPGVASSSFMRFLGCNPNQITTRLYGASGEIFYSDSSLHQRERRFTFIGQLIKRKGLITLIEAWKIFHRKHPSWSLSCVGSGPLAEILGQTNGITVNAFSSPEEVASIMRRSRALVLPSIKEHWGVVVHEATLSGLPILCSNRVGAALDLVNSINGILYPPNHAESLAKALETCATWAPDRLQTAQDESLLLANYFGPSAFSLAAKHIVSLLANRTPTNPFQNEATDRGNT